MQEALKASLHPIDPFQLILKNRNWRSAFTTHDDSVIGGGRPCNLYRIQRAAHRENQHCRSHTRRESGLSARHRLRPLGSPPDIHCRIRVHIRHGSHRDHGQMPRLDSDHRHNGFFGDDDGD
jgi:hypothetical protein